MAIAPAAAHGVTSDRLTATTIAHTTSGAVASGNHVHLQVMWFSASVTVASVSGGGLTWQIDVQGAPSSSRHIALISGYAPAGLAAGTTITVTFSATTTDRSLGVDSFSGMDPSDWVGVSGTVNNTSTSTWGTGSIAISANSMLLAMAHEDAGATASAPSAGTTELHDQQVTGTTDMWVSGYRIESSAGSYAVGGTWTGAASQSSVGYVEYLVAGGGGTTDTAPQGVATATGISPTPRATANAGTAPGTGVSPTARATASQGVATGAGISPNSSASTTPTVGAATGQGISPTARATASAGVATRAGAAPTARATASAGVATATGISPTDSSSTSHAAPQGVAVAVGISPSSAASATPTQGVAVAQGIAPSDSSSTSHSAPQGLATAAGVSPSSLVTITPTPAFASALGIAPVIAVAATARSVPATGVAPTVRALAGVGVATGAGIQPTFTGETAPGHMEPGVFGGVGVEGLAGSVGLDEGSSGGSGLIE